MRLSIGILGILLSVLLVQNGCHGNVGLTGTINPPSVRIDLSDTLITASAGLDFTVVAADNISLRRVQWFLSGVVDLDSTITFTTATPFYIEQFTVAEELTPGWLLIVAAAIDIDDHEAVPDSVRVTISN